MPNRIEKNWEIKRVEPSYSERMIMKRLKNEKFRFMQEVCFTSCRSPATGNHLRYDFYLPDMNILIEYDGKAYHEGEHVVERDAVKTKYARDFNIKLIRISGLTNIDVAINKLCEIRKSRQERKRANDRAKLAGKCIREAVQENKVKTRDKIVQAVIANRERMKEVPDPTYVSLPRPKRKGGYNKSEAAAAESKKRRQAFIETMKRKLDRRDA